MESITFAKFMELALYHPVHGYYSDPRKRKIGRTGDFFTSVSVGDTFGFLLAQRIIALDQAGAFGTDGIHIVEQGAHDGQLARDISAALTEVGRPFSYQIIEPRETVRKRLRQNCDTAIELCATIAEARSESGIFLCNELLDAFPTHRIQFEDGEWREMQVGLTDRGDLEWATRDLGPELQRHAAGLGTDFENGYETEICLAVEPWIAEIAGLFVKGRFWLIDYGHTADDYFAPTRRTGTLRCYREHRATEDPFTAIGETDITTHVNFTHLGELATASGLREIQYTDQHHFLIEAAKPWLLSIEGRPPDESVRKRLRQFQTLTHPGMMGQQFKVLEMESK